MVLYFLCVGKTCVLYAKYTFRDGNWTLWCWLRFSLFVLQRKTRCAYVFTGLMRIARATPCTLSKQLHKSALAC